MRTLECSFAMLLVVAGPVLGVPPSLPGLTTRTVTSTDGPIPIPDNNPSGLLLSLTLPGLSGMVVDVEVGIDIQHAAPNQLRIELVSPSGTIVTLSTNNGGTNADVFTGTLFDDQAAPAVPGTPAPNVRNFTYAAGSPTGSLQPEEPLGALLGEPAAGLYGLASTWFLVVRDDAGGTTGTIRSWSLTVSVLPTGALHPGAAAHFQLDAPGSGTQIPDGNATGTAFPLTVAGVATRLYDVDVTVDVAHPNSGDLELLLASPSGQQIDLVTRLGGGNDDLYAGTTFSDTAGTPASDTTLPASGTAFGRVTGEGALSTFLGEDPNGQWVLTVLDRAGGSVGRLRHWSLDIRTSNTCGDGVLDAGETCDDGNLASGDGCDANCSPTACGNSVVTAGEDCDDGNTVDGDTCPAACRQAEAVCDDCLDNDGDGLADAADPGCGARQLQLTRARMSHGRLTLVGFIPVTTLLTGPLALVVADAHGTRLCAGMGTVGSSRRERRLRAGAAGGTLAVTVSGPHGDKFVVSGRRLALSTLEGTVTVGLDISGNRFSGSTTLHARTVHAPRR